MTPVRRPNSELRPRGEHLTDREVRQLVEAARGRGRHGHRDATAILIAYRHGLRVSELCSLRWTQVDFDERQLHVTRVKRGRPSIHDLTSGEIDALRALRSASPSEFVFTSQRRRPMTAAGFAKMLARTAESIGFPIKAHPHMLRHACGYKLVNDGRDLRSIQHYLGHRNIAHTVRYTELDGSRFRGFFGE